MPGWNYVVDLVVFLITSLHNVVGSWGFAIILFTVLMKIVTFPLTSQQIRSSKAMAELQPRMKEIQEKYKNDKEKQSQEMLKMYQELGVNPLSGCLPLLIQLPIWLALFGAISQLATAGQMGGFGPIPDLSCPTTGNAACGIAGEGPQWILNFALWGETWPYIVLVILTVATQILLTRVMTASRPATPAKNATGKPSEQDATMQAMNQMNMIMPFMFGFFALTYPAGLSLYWVTNNVLTFIQYFFLNRMHNTTPNLAAATPSGGTVEVEVTPKTISEGGTNDQARRKRKKR
jgi:YidC/Oxa1 family membrane protein insertase